MAEGMLTGAPACQRQLEVYRESNSTRAVAESLRETLDDRVGNIIKLPNVS